MDSIYLISSNSYRMLEDELKKIVKDNRVTIFDLNAIEIDDVLEEAAYFSLFDEKKYIVVKNASIFGSSKRKTTGDEDSVSKKDEKLIKYLEEPNLNTVLIFCINGKIDSKKKICKLIKDRYNLIVTDDLKPKEIASKVEESLKKEGYKVDSNIAYFIVNNSLNNYDLAMNEVDKIKLYYGKGTIVKMDDVKNIVSHNLEDNTFKWIDAVMNKNMNEAYKIYDDLMIQKEEPIKLMVMLSKQIRNTLLLKKMLNSYNKKDIMSTLGISYDFQYERIVNSSYSFKEKELEDYLVLLADFDYKIKRGKIGNKLALEMFILYMCK